MSLIPTNKSITQITDDIGQVFVYNSQLNQWLQASADYDKSIVSISNDGLVTPNIIKLLETVNNANHNNQFIGVKVLQNPNAYWYYLQNPDIYFTLFFNC